VFNWAVPEVRQNKFAFIEEICRKYDIAVGTGFYAHPNYFRPEETPLAERREIMTTFVRHVREVLDQTARPGSRRWLCVRVPALPRGDGRAGARLARVCPGRSRHD